MSRPIRLAGSTVDLDRARLVRDDGAIVSLHASERALLSTLVEAPGEVVDNEALLERLGISGSDPAPLYRVVHSLRAKLGDDPEVPSCLLTVRGLGYRLRTLDEEAPEAVPHASVRLGRRILDLRGQRILVDGPSPDVSEAIGLSAQEARLLECLVYAGGEVVSKGDLLHTVWGWRGTATRAVDMAVHRLRKKVEEDPSAPRHLLTDRGDGYRLVDFQWVETRAPAEGADHRLPVRLDGFVGRDLELRHVSTLWQRGVRWVALSGLGGIGKSRLALEAARRHPAGRSVWIGGAKRTRAEAMRTLLEAFGISTETEDGLPDLLGREPATLVVWDDIDDTRDGLALALELLEAIPRIDLLTTSRTKPEVLGATHVHVDLLTADDAQALVELRFAAAHGRTATPSEVLSFVDALDRIPLAIEVGVTNATAEPSVRSLDATIQRSLDLVPAPAAELLAALATFPTTLDTEEARGVAQRGGFDATHLQGLIDLGFFERAEAGRLAMHRAVREGSSSRATPAIRDRAREAYVAYWAERLSVPASFDALRPHLLSVRRCLEIGGDDAVAIAAVLARHVQQLHPWAEWRDLYAPLVEPRERNSDVARIGLARLQFLLGDPSCEATLAPLLEPDTERETLLLATLAQTGMSMGFGRRDEASAHAERALAIAVELGEPRLECEAAFTASQVWTATARADRAAAVVRDALRRAMVLGDPELEGRLWCRLAWAEIANADLQSGLASAERALELAQEGDAFLGALAHRCAGVAGVALGMLDEASAHAEAALDLVMPVYRTDALLMCAEIEVRRGRWDDAERWARDALRAISDPTRAQVEPLVWIVLGWIALGRRTLGGARAAFEHAIDVASALGLHPYAALASGWLAVVFARLGSKDDALSCLAVAEAGVPPQDRTERAVLDVLRADVHASLGNKAAVRTALQDVEAYLTRTGARLGPTLEAMAREAGDRVTETS